MQTVRFRRNIEGYALNALVLACVAAVFGGGYLLWEHFSTARLVLMGLGALLALAILTGLAYSTKEMASEFHEARRLRTTLRRLPADGEFDADDLVGLLAGLRSARAAAVLLRFACGRDLATSPSLTRAISDLGTWAEDGNAATGLGPQVAGWVATGAPKSHSAVRGVRGTVLDAMARAVEQAELERQRQQAPT